MMLKVRIRRYRQEDVETIKKFMLEWSLAQNVQQEQAYLTGDFVAPRLLLGVHYAYLERVKSLNEEFNVEAEVVVG